MKLDPARTCAVLAGVLACAAAAAQAPAAPGAPSAPSALASTPSDPRPEPRTQRLVVEDDQVRVEELRVRGETRRILVQPKAPGARPYEIAPGTGAQDPSQRGPRPPGSSQWRVLDF